MDVEVEDGEPRQLVDRARLHGADGDIVEHAKAHGLHGLGMVAGRAHGAERPGGLTGHHGVDRGAGGAGGTQRGLARMGVEHGVGIDPGVARRPARRRGCGLV